MGRINKVLKVPVWIFLQKGETGHGDARSSEQKSVFGLVSSVAPSDGTRRDESERNVEPNHGKRVPFVDGVAIEPADPRGLDLH